MRVAQVVSGMPTGGAERVVVELIRRAPSGWEPALFCLGEEGPLHAPVRAAGARVVNLGKPPGCRPWAALRLAGALGEFAPQVVHSHLLAADGYAALAVRLLPRGSRPARVSTVHSIRPWRNGRERRLAKLLLGRATVVAVAPEVAGVLAGAGMNGYRLHCIECGVDLEALRADPARVAEWRSRLKLGPGPVVGTVGRLSLEKGQRHLVAACGELARSFPDLQLVVVGDGPERAALERLADVLLPGRCRFAGWAVGVGELLALMDVFCLPSEQEGLPLALLEAMGAGKPVVATAVGGVPGVVAHAVDGLVVPPGKPGALAGMLARVLADPGWGRTLGERARGTVERRYGVARMVERYYRLYERLSAEAGGDG